MGVTTINSINNHGSDEKHTEGHGDDFTPGVSPGTTERRKQLFENMLVLEVFAGSSNLTVEIRKAHLRGVAVDKTIGRAKGPIPFLDLALKSDVELLAEFIRREAENICLIPFAPPCGICSAARKRNMSQAVLDKLANKGITSPQVLRLVSEFATYSRFAILPHFDDDKIADKQLKGSRIIARKLWMWGDLRVSSPGEISFEFLGGLECSPDSTAVGLITIEVPREPWDFVKHAAAVGHHSFITYSGTPQMDEFISANLDGNATGLVSLRSEFFNKWLKKARKRLLWCRDILTELDCPDRAVFDDIGSGFKLSGWLRDSMVFTGLPRPPKIPMETRLKSSAGLQKAVLRQVAEPEDAALHQAAWEET